MYLNLTLLLCTKLKRYIIKFETQKSLCREVIMTRIQFYLLLVDVEKTFSITKKLKTRVVMGRMRIDSLNILVVNVATDMQPEAVRPSWSPVNIKP